MIHEYIMYIKFTFNKAMQCFPHAMPHQSSILATARNISKHEYKMYHYKRIQTMDGVQAPFLSVNSSAHAQNIHYKEVEVKTSFLYKDKYVENLQNSLLLLLRI